ncbi:hypothetical protein M8J76_010304 [Diaphorina citri]|nr:hypothetical protein M8J76_010304 [Diaphorina citri]
MVILFVVSAETVRILLIELEFCCALRSNWFFDGISTSINVNLATSISGLSGGAGGTGGVTAGSLNTPVIALQTPLLGGSYSNLFGDITGSDMSLNWTSTSATTSHTHTTGLPHLGVTASPPLPPSSSSSQSIGGGGPPPPPPPSLSPSPSPRPLRIKAEPISPPRSETHGSTLATLSLTQAQLATSHHLLTPMHINPRGLVTPGPHSTQHCLPRWKPHITPTTRPCPTITTPATIPTPE